MKRARRHKLTCFPCSSNDQLHTYRASFRQGLTPQEKKAHNEKFSRFKGELANMKQEMKMLKQAFEYKSVKGPKVQTEDIKISGDKLLEETDKVVDEQQEIADRMIRVVEETKEVGLATLEQLDENTQQLNNIADTATGIRQDIKKANQLVNRYRRRLMTDRVIWVFTFLVFCAIVGIIVYSTVNPSQDTFMVPDVVKPPSANDVEQQVNNIASR